MRARDSDLWLYCNKFLYALYLARISHLLGLHGGSAHQISSCRKHCTCTVRTWIIVERPRKMRNALPHSLVWWISAAVTQIHLQPLNYVFTFLHKASRSTISAREPTFPRAKVQKKKRQLKDGYLGFCFLFLGSVNINWLLSTDGSHKMKSAKRRVAAQSTTSTVKHRKLRYHLIKVRCCSINHINNQAQKAASSSLHGQVSLLQYTSLFQSSQLWSFDYSGIVHNSPYDKLSVGVQSLTMIALESDIHNHLKPYLLPPIISMSRHKTRTSTHHPQAATWTWVPFITKFTTKTTLPSLWIEPIGMSSTQTFQEQSGPLHHGSTTYAKFKQATVKKRKCSMNFPKNELLFCSKTQWVNFLQNLGPNENYIIPYSLP